MNQEKSHPTKAERRASARERVEQMRQEEERRRKITVALVATVATVAVIGSVVLGAYLMSQRETQQAQSGQTPSNVTAVGGVMMPAVGNPSSQNPAATDQPEGEPQQPAPSQKLTPVTVTEYYDYACPGCKQFSETIGPTLNALRDEGKVTIEYVPLGMLDDNRSNFSTRSAAATYCVSEHDRDKFSAFNDAVYASQPSNGRQPNNNQLRDFAQDIGAGQETQQCIVDETYVDYVKLMQREASKRGINSTPTILVNGQLLRRNDLGDLMAMIEAASQQPAQQEQQPPAQP